MKGLKFLAACAAVGAVSVACAVSSLAADPTYQLTVSKYDEENGTIDITVPAEYTALVGGDYTLLVLTEAGNAAASITNENSGEVVQIQQGDSNILTGVKVGTGLEVGTYYVRVGGADATEANPTGFAAGEFTVGTALPYADSTLKLLDVNGSGGDPDGADLVALKKHIAGIEGSILSGECLGAADCNDSGAVDGADLVLAKKHISDPENNPLSTVYLKDKVKLVTE